MNKILPYIVIAILLGTVTMVIPYALLGPSDYTSLTDEDTLTQTSPPETEQPSEPTETPTETEQLDNQERTYTEGGNLEGDLSSPTETESPAEETPTTAEPSEAEPQEPTQEALVAALDETDLITKSLSHLPSIGLMIIPSFLIALGAFIYLKKRRS